MSWFILVPLLNLPTAIADEAPPPPIVNGESTEDWPAVGQLMMCWGSCDMFCSGTLVDERWVITAAHCVEALDEYADYGYKMKFGVGPSLQDIEDSALIASWASHPSYNSYTLKHDIGVIELESDITAVEPMAVNKDSVSNAWVGESLTYVGYGVTSDYENDGGVKRYAEMPLESYDSGLLYSLDTSDGQNVCYGDSGGAVLEDVGGGTYELAGVNSYVYGYQYSGYSCEGGGSGATRVDTHLDWILDYVDVLAADENDGGDSDSDGGSGSGSGPSIDAWAHDILVVQGSSARTEIVVEDEGSYGFTVLEAPEGGEASVSEDGVVWYMADEDFSGEDVLLVEVSGEGATDEIEVWVEVIERGADDSELKGGCAVAGGSGGSAPGLLALLGLVLGVRRRETA